MNTPEASASRAAIEFASAVRRVRDRQGLTQAQLSERSGLSAAAISQIESGQREPTFSTIVRLATALQTSPNDLMGLGPEAKPDPTHQALYRDLKGLSQDDYEKVTAFAQWLLSQKK